MLFMLKDIRVKNKKIKVVKNHDKSKLNEDIDVVKAKARKTCMSYNYVFSYLLIIAKKKVIQNTSLIDTIKTKLRNYDLTNIDASALEKYVKTSNSLKIYVIYRQKCQIFCTVFTVSLKICKQIELTSKQYNNTDKKQLF